MLMPNRPRFQFCRARTANGSALCHRQLRRPRGARRIKINGDGLPVRSFMHMGDAMWWLFTILLAGKAGDDFNVGSPEAVTIAELATRVREVVNPDIAVDVAGASNLSPGNPLNHYYVPDTSKGEAQLGLENPDEPRGRSC